MKNFRIRHLLSGLLVLFPSLLAFAFTACSAKKNRGKEENSPSFNRDTVLPSPPVRVDDELPVCMYGVPYRPYQDSIVPMDEMNGEDLPSREELEE